MSLVHKVLVSSVFFLNFFSDKTSGDEHRRASSSALMNAIVLESSVWGFPVWSILMRESPSSGFTKVKTCSAASKAR